jgi:hypothetical protein
VVAAIGHKGDFEYTSHGIDEPKAGIVTRVFVVRAWIAQSDKELDHGR